MARKPGSDRRGPILSVLLAVFPSVVDAGEAPGSRHFTLNEQMIGSLSMPAAPPACDPLVTLTDLLKQVGPTAKIYPTQNYYYFQFYRVGKSYSGSLRLTPGKREKGIIEFACYESYASWMQIEHEADFHADLSSEHGVLVTQVGHLSYEVALAGYVTTFSLNDLDQSPNEAVLADGERFAGRVFDESGLRFDLVYIPARKAFLFVLDARSPVHETFVTVSPKVHLGRRTGFVLYEDVDPKRYVLVAVHSEETYRNSWLDGPFDQLPENFYEAVGFWTYVYDAFPELKGRLTPNGTFLDNGTTFAVVPYRVYLSEAGLAFILDCIKDDSPRVDQLVCLTTP